LNFSDVTLPSNEPRSATVIFVLDEGASVPLVALGAPGDRTGARSVRPGCDDARRPNVSSVPQIATIAEVARRLMRRLLADRRPEEAHHHEESREEGDKADPRWGVFATTVVAFFIAEMGDKTQIATVMLAAQFQSWFWVVAGTTLGMMLANAPVVWLGEAITRKISLAWVHRVSAVVFAILGALALWGGPSSESEKPIHAPQALPTALYPPLSRVQL
jgi:hypothetical protein